MSKVKNVSGGDLDVPLLNRVVAPDEVVEVPDFQGDGESPIVWPPDKWEPVTAKKAAPAVTAEPPPEPAPPDQAEPPPPPVSSDPRERR